MVFDGLETDGQQQLRIFEPSADTQRRARLMADLDALNERYGRGTVGFAIAQDNKTGKDCEWVGRKQLLTPAYTTDFGQLWRINMDGPAF